MMYFLLAAVSDRNIIFNSQNAKSVDTCEPLQSCVFIHESWNIFIFSLFIE